jgi:hypothetical protein
MSLWEKIELSFSVLYDVKNTFPLSTLFLLTTVSFLQSLIFVLFSTYVRLRNEVLHKEKVGITISFVLSFVGSSCVACSGAVASLLSSLAIFGGSATIISFDSTFILLVTIVLLSIVLIRLLKKVENPFVC